jgi:hypothetical protein
MTFDVSARDDLDRHSRLRSGAVQGRQPWVIEVQNQPDRCQGQSGALQMGPRRPKLDDAEQKAKDAASDLQAVVEGKSSSEPRASSVCFL